MPLEFLKLTDTFLAEKGKKTLKPMKGSPLHCRAYKGVANISLFISDQTCPPGVLFPFNMGRHLIVVVVGWWADGGVGLG